MPSNHAPFGDVVNAIREHTALLLGATIGYSEGDWAAPTKLSGWSRSHVAAHLVEGARAMVRVIEGLHAGVNRPMYESAAEKRRAIELGALSDGLELQIQLDTSASELHEQLGSLEHDERRVTLSPAYRIPACDLPLARLSEVIVHHMDLDPHFMGGDLRSDLAVALLALHVERIGRREDYPPLRLVAEEGYIGKVGRPAEPTVMQGPARDLLAWLVRGTESSRIFRSTDLPD